MLRLQTGVFHARVHFRGLKHRRNSSGSCCEAESDAEVDANTNFALQKLTAGFLQVQPPLGPLGSLCLCFITWFFPKQGSILFIPEHYLSRGVRKYFKIFCGYVWGQWCMQSSQIRPFMACKGDLQCCQRAFPKIGISLYQPPIC